MKEKQRDKEVLWPRMNPPGAGERRQNNHLLVEEVPVWYNRNGQVNPERLSACKEERNLTGSFNYTVNHFKETAVHVSTYGGVRGRQRLNTFAPYSIVRYAYHSFLRCKS